MFHLNRAKVPLFERHPVFDQMTTTLDKEKQKVRDIQKRIKCRFLVTRKLFRC